MLIAGIVNDIMVMKIMNLLSKAPLLPDVLIPQNIEI